MFANGTHIRYRDTLHVEHESVICDELHYSVHNAVLSILFTDITNIQQGCGKRILTAHFVFSVRFILISLDGFKVKVSLAE